jgi:hypothetical protein
MGVAWAVYLAGVVTGLWMVDGRPAARIALALLWPLGPLAFVVTVTGLFLAALVAFPLFGGLVAAAAAAAAWMLR